jgi:hypothetical protein
MINPKDISAVSANLAVKQTQFAGLLQEDELHGLKAILQSLRPQRLNKPNPSTTSILVCKAHPMAKRYENETEKTKPIRPPAAENSKSEILTSGLSAVKQSQFAGIFCGRTRIV